MLRALEDMPDEAMVSVFVATRALRGEEQGIVLRITDSWLQRWHAAFDSPASHGRIVFDGRVLIWAVDTRPREAEGAIGGLVGTELDPLLRNLERFAASASPPVDISPGEALLIRDEVIPFGPEWIRVLRATGDVADVRVVHGCSIAEWRAGLLARPLADDPRGALLLRNA